MVSFDHAPIDIADLTHPIGGGLNCWFESFGHAPTHFAALLLPIVEGLN